MTLTGRLVSKQNAFLLILGLARSGLMRLPIPVVLIIFDRPELTRRVLAEIARQQPTTLLLIGDGPRPDDETCRAKVAQTRSVVEAIDWPCNVLKSFSQTNLGCKRRISSGLDWVFDRFEQAIILEDDCLPEPSFFEFCETLLTRYRNDSRLWAISGDNFQFGNSRTEASYYFSKYPHCWGWATWRRAWRKMDLSLTAWSDFRRTEVFASRCGSLREQDYWTSIFDAQHRGEIDSWAFPWTYSSFYHGGLTALPNVNLVSNIGFGDQASHTGDQFNRLANLPTQAICDIRHPDRIQPHLAADRFTFENVFSPVESHSSPKKQGLKKLFASIRDRFSRGAGGRPKRARSKRGTAKCPTD